MPFLLLSLNPQYFYSKMDPADTTITAVVALMAQGLTDESFKYHLQSAKANGITKEEIAEIVTHAAFLLRMAESMGSVPHGKRSME